MSISRRLTEINLFKRKQEGWDTGHEEDTGAGKPCVFRPGRNRNTSGFNRRQTLAGRVGEIVVSPKSPFLE